MRRLVRPDQRGHGRPTWGPAGPLSIDLLGSALVAAAPRRLAAGTASNTSPTAATATATA